MIIIINALDDKEQVDRSHKVAARHRESCKCEDCTISQMAYDTDFINKTGVWKDHGRAGY